MDRIPVYSTLRMAPLPGVCQVSPKSMLPLILQSQFCPTSLLSWATGGQFVRPAYPGNGYGSSAPAAGPSSSAQWRHDSFSCHGRYTITKDAAGFSHNFHSLYLGVGFRNFAYCYFKTGLGPLLSLSHISSSFIFPVLFSFSTRSLVETTSSWIIEFLISF